MKTLFITALAAASVACAETYTTGANSSEKNRGGYFGFTMSLSATYLSTSPTQPSGTVYLTGMTYAIHDNPDSVSSDIADSIKIAVYSSSDEFLGLSTAIDVSKETVTSSAGKVQSLAFDGGVEITFSDTYKFVFVSNTETTETLASGTPASHSVKAGVQLLSGVSGATNVLYSNAGLTNYQGGNYIPNVTFTTTDVAPSPAVPEPATATLSLLALAGLAARRRRR